MSLEEYLKQDSRTAIRTILKIAVDNDRLFSLDEIVGTLATIASVGTGFLALIWIDMRTIFSLISFILIVYFWLSYRIARILHAIEIRIWLMKSFLWFFPIAMGLSFLALQDVFRPVNVWLSYLVGSAGVVLIMSGSERAIRFDICSWLCRKPKSGDEKTTESIVKLCMYLSEPSYMFITSWGLIPAALIALPLFFGSDNFSQLLVAIIALILISSLSIVHQYKSYDIKKRKITKLFIEESSVEEKVWTRKHVAGIIGSLAVVYIMGILLLHYYLPGFEFTFGILFWPIILFLLSLQTGWELVQC